VIVEKLVIQKEIKEIPVVIEVFKDVEKIVEVIV